MQKILIVVYCNHLKLEITQCHSSEEWINSETSVQWNDIYQYKGECIATSTNIDGFQMPYVA